MGFQMVRGLFLLLAIFALANCHTPDTSIPKRQDGSFKLPSQPSFLSSFTSFVITLSIMVAFLAIVATCSVIWILWKAYAACCRKCKRPEGLPGLSWNGRCPEPVRFYNIAYRIDEDCTVVELPDPIFKQESRF